MNYAVIFAGGTGTRMNTKTRPKQFLTLHGKEIIIYTLEHFENHPDIDGISVVCIAEWIDYLKKLLDKYQIKKVKWISAGGSTGQESIYNGLNAMREDIGGDSIVLIHDGVRPLINEKLISENIKMAKEKGCAVTVVPATETVMLVDENEQIVQSVDRHKCRVVRAPQSFVYQNLLKAHDRAREMGVDNMIDSATMMSEAGYTLYPVVGKADNIKITTPSDFYTFRAIVEAEENSQIFG
ncbi:2-C-methyl-D-erythritol 4-phosphate cytidylyltransferase [Faecalicatena contorta]|uniref:2-C-methyl-D-erythritol 4-phosphate cytidylyltransferase n=1 Tax=Faecalicatena contorta TaxID=39482 RepID=A0A316AEY9_9FIRM|nr:2-C-methyl-D-erythritol 4-phosphate cytidylyltransferase [Faecalicatena contorta]PWJ48357.1 2-C-methyl-D-erythritol 4-phosphate cytidylyltransferase [Faecalicatena contorta]SUQ15380.1 2-C-methyl-D-erythritol 4-phosphate cytidylyltransferase [Faecalicatena contorta]